MHGLCVRARDEGDGSPNSSFYRPRQGVGWDVEIPKYPSFMSHMKGHNGNTRGAPPWQPLGRPTSCLPPRGGPPNKPPTCLHETCMLPRQKATKHATPDSWDLVPSRWDKMFSAKLFSEKFQKVPEHFWHPLKLFWA